MHEPKPFCSRACIWWDIAEWRRGVKGDEVFEEVFEEVCDEINDERVDDAKNPIDEKKKNNQNKQNKHAKNDGAKKNASRARKDERNDEKKDVISMKCDDKKIKNNQKKNLDQKKNPDNGGNITEKKTQAQIENGKKEAKDKKNEQHKDVKQANSTMDGDECRMCGDPACGHHNSEVPCMFESQKPKRLLIIHKTGDNPKFEWT
jgi:hypothetical protein